MHRVRPLLVLLVLAVLAAVPVAAQATDSHAPRGARGDRLPSDQWAMSQWLPYDEATVDHLLHTDRDELASWLNDQRTLGQLARRRGFRDQRALDTLTHAHLARHVLSTSTTRPRSGPRRGASSA